MNQEPTTGWITGGDLLVRTLAACGVDTIFGVPGDTNMGLYAAIARSGGRIAHVLARDERSASFMADAYARFGGRIGVCECPSGAGVLYSIPGVAEANASAVPLLLLSCDWPLATAGRGVIAELDCVRALDGLVKTSIVATLPEQIPECVRRALQLATTGRPGAVQLVLPDDVVNAEVEPPTAPLRQDGARWPTPAPPGHGVDDQIVARLAEALQAAERPLIVAGNGVNLSGAQSELLAAAERFGAPVATTLTGKGAVPESHPLSIGIIGDNGFYPGAMRAISAADLLVYIGSKMGSVATCGWSVPDPDAGVRIVHIDVDCRVLGANYRAVIGLAADAKQVLRKLLRHAPPAPPVRPWTQDLAAEKAEFLTAIAALSLDDATPLKPERIVGALGRRLTSPASIIVDPGTPTPYVARYIDLSRSGSRFVSPRGFGGLGYALPAVVGAWRARPEARPIALFGDGAFGMSAGELETLARLRTPAILMLFNNASFAWIHTLQKTRGYDQAMSVAFSDTNVARIAQAYGMPAWRVTSGEELDCAMDEAFAAAGPCFLDIVTESSAERLPPMYGWMMRSGLDPLARHRAPAGDVPKADAALPAE